MPVTSASPSSKRSAMRWASSSNWVDAFRQQGQLTAEDLIQTAAQQGPVVAGDGEVASEVEQGLLADLARDAMGANQAVGEVGLTGWGAAGLGAADEHGRDGNRGGRGGQAPIIRLWHYIRSSDQESTTYGCF